VVRVLVLLAEGPAMIREIEDELEVLQKIVGGDIEEFHFARGLIIMNEDKTHLPLNEGASLRAGIKLYGDVIIAGGTDYNGSLTDYRPPD